jgi:hypothetical protein
MGAVCSNVYRAAQGSVALYALTWAVVLSGWAVFVFGLADVRGAFEWYDVCYGLAICAAFLPLRGLLPRASSADEEEDTSTFANSEDTARAECRTNLLLGCTVTLLVGGLLGAFIRSYFAWFGGGHIPLEDPTSGPPEGWCACPVTTPPPSTPPLTLNATTTPTPTVPGFSPYGSLPGVILLTSCGLFTLAIALCWFAALEKREEVRRARNGGGLALQTMNS